MTIGSLATDEALLRKEFRVRNNVYKEQTFAVGDADQAYKDGWELKKEYQASVRLKKLKSIDEIMENELWVLLYNLGYNCLNIGRNFSIKVAGKGKTIYELRIAAPKLW